MNLGFSRAGCTNDNDQGPRWTLSQHENFAAVSSETLFNLCLKDELQILGRYHSTYLG